MKKLPTIVFLLLLIIIPRVEARAAGSITEILNVLIENDLLHDAYNDDPGLGKQVCEYFVRPAYECSSFSTINSMSLGKGICLASGRPAYECGNVRSVIDGINIFNANRIGRDWDWDYQPGNSQWVCRGIQTGQYAEHHNCQYDALDDDRWP